MTRTITRSYDDYDTARSVVEQLEASGVSSSNVSLMGRNGDTDESNAGEGAGIGAGVGGAAGLLAGLGLLAIPGVGPVVAAGWLAATAAGAVAGAAAGGLVGSFIKEGHDEDEANYYAETVRRGGSVVSVRAEPAQEAEVEAILDGATPIDRHTRMAQYRQEGWTRFDEKADPYLRGQAGI
ncbi:MULTISPECIES: hypothetical protein [unclassified Bosea (in: a-proteobacteria)]|uniref:hypothetical protein n=1 Tax=unclassified Bosea (in: a-proteobacteria) TaxID=2653178 RepID=UPI000F753C69|nr:MULTISPECIES: hypothetical protein [unclassified Bosea (in: a-proteobacteria)]AZO77455.1 hypothetical protein BLM15_07410 [Bosea sp. Tri-49]RXT18061.1 hypothetical protein B5U98_22565 [Bosea sp. Tri-39]RXT32659.1 hypothetical protein B5U99_28910 [Bosea sp. Tri-54]